MSNLFYDLCNSATSSNSSLNSSSGGVFNWVGFFHLHRLPMSLIHQVQNEKLSYFPNTIEQSSFTLVDILTGYFSLSYFYFESHFPIHCVTNEFTILILVKACPAIVLYPQSCALMISNVIMKYWYTLLKCSQQISYQKGQYGNKMKEWNFKR